MLVLFNFIFFFFFFLKENVLDDVIVVDADQENIKIEGIVEDNIQKGVDNVVNDLQLQVNGASDEVNNDNDQGINVIAQELNANERAEVENLNPQVGQINNVNILVNNHQRNHQNINGVQFNPRVRNNFEPRVAVGLGNARRVVARIELPLHLRISNGRVFRISRRNENLSIV